MQIENIFPRLESQGPHRSKIAIDELAIANDPHRIDATIKNLAEPKLFVERNRRGHGVNWRPTGIRENPNHVTVFASGNPAKELQESATTKLAPVTLGKKQNGLLARLAEERPREREDDAQRRQRLKTQPYSIGR